MKKNSSKVREYAEAIIIAVIIALFVRTFVVQAFKIPSGSMKPTLQIGDHILVNKFIYGVKIPYIQKTLIPIREPEREDIVVFRYPRDRSKDFIKRVIGVGGDVIEIRDKEVFLNGSSCSDIHGVHTDNLMLPSSIQPRDNMEPVRVPAGYIFVMGDNRDQSYDSRFWGFVKLKDVMGKAFIIYWSWNGNDHRVRWKRFGKVLR